MGRSCCSRKEAATRRCGWTFSDERKVGVRSVALRSEGSRGRRDAGARESSRQTETKLTAEEGRKGKRGHRTQAEVGTVQPRPHRSMRVHRTLECQKVTGSSDLNSRKAGSAGAPAQWCLVPLSVPSLPHCPCCPRCSCTLWLVCGGLRVGAQKAVELARTAQKPKDPKKENRRQRNLKKQRKRHQRRKKRERRKGALATTPSS